MIDPHVHLRDFNETQKETLIHGLSVAYRAGLDAVFEMPNTDPPLTGRKILEKRIILADSANVGIFHGIFGGLTCDPAQIREIAEAYSALFPRVVGLKLFAGTSTGTLGVTSEAEQTLVFETLVSLGYTGVLSVHCEKVSRFKPELANPEDPFSHTLARPPESETESVSDIISIAEKCGFGGRLHICHVSVPESIDEAGRAKKRGRIRIACGITPHHALLKDELMKTKDGYLLRMNPPLRPKSMQERMLALLLEGKIDWIETDHAPHTLKEKRAASGIPSLPYYPDFITRLKDSGMNKERLYEVTHKNIEEYFDIRIPESNRIPERGLQSEYEFDPFKDF